MTVPFPVHTPPGLSDAIMTSLRADLIKAAYAAAPGNEIESGKFLSPESSSALVANAFGLFLERPGDLPPIPGLGDRGWPARSVGLEAIVRFPWNGGRHPCLDVLIETNVALIGIESKRYEPFRSKTPGAMSDAYWRPVWGKAMGRYEAVRDRVRDGALSFRHLDAVQLIKHAFGLRTAVHHPGPRRGRVPVLVYLFAEPKAWPDGRPVPRADIAAHRAEVRRFADLVAGDEVAFASCSYHELLSAWTHTGPESVRAHAAALSARFDLGK